MTTVEKTLFYFWGEGGEYGPFDLQQDGEWAGWPDFGQVMRYFRKKAKLSSKAFGVLYGKEVSSDGSPIVEGWIREMETQNKVPVDINKRKTIARLLHIPPVLLGLAALEPTKQEERSQARQKVTVKQNQLPQKSIDTTKYQSTVRIIWQVHDTGNAQSALSQLEADIRDLKRFELSASGDLRFHVQEILFGYLLLATHIVRDQRQFRCSYSYANEAVRVAKSMLDDDFIATALFTRGWTRLEWGLYGMTKQGVFQVQQETLQAAMRDFDAALKVFPQNGSGAMHSQLRGRLAMHKSRAQATLALSKGERIPPSLLLMLDDIADTVGKQNIDDLHTRALIIGTRKGWHQAAYLQTRAAVFHAARLPGKALREINTLEDLAKKAYLSQETREFAWLDILKANIYMSLEEFSEATYLARRALVACQDIHSVTNTAIIGDIYGRLLAGPHKASADVKEIGDLLRASASVEEEPSEA